MKIEAVIDDVVIEPRRIQPIIVNFQNGQLKDNEAKKMKSGMFYDNKNKKTLLAMSNGQVVYRGYRPESSKSLTYTMLAVHNKKTGKIKLIQAERWQVAPVLDKEPEISSYIDENNSSKHTALSRQFGSKKIQRRIEQNERMKINIETVKDQLEQTVSNIELGNEDLETKDDDETAVDLPPCNRNATVVTDVYNINDFIPKDMLEMLQSKVDEILELERTSDFYVKTLKALENDPQSARKIAILEFIQSITTWLGKPIKNIKKLVDEICPVSREVGQHILETYSMNSPSGRLRPATMKDKALFHCIILSLIISNFKVNLELLSTMLKSRVGLKKLQELSRLIGATPSRDDKRLIILKLPLPPPTKLVKTFKKNKK